MKDLTHSLIMFVPIPLGTALYGSFWFWWWLNAICIFAIILSIMAYFQEKRAVKHFKVKYKYISLHHAKRKKTSAQGKKSVLQRRYRNPQ